MARGYAATFLLLLLLLLGGGAAAQTPGMIFQKALNPGPTTLDPNNDGYVSKFSTGFVGTADMGTNSEIPFRFLPQLPSPNSPEPLADLTTGSNGGHTDLANVPLGVYYNGTDLIFRMRVGGSSTASKGYSYLLDTDKVFNKLKLANGTLIDYVTPSKVTNLGFEYEVVLALNFDVIIYRHKGSGDQNDPMTSNIIWRGTLNGGYNKYFQKSVAASLAGGDTDYFFDFYVPLSAFSADGGPGILPTTPLRISGSTVTSAQTGLEGTISDIGGVDDKKFGNDKIRMWKELIPSFPPTTPLQIQAGDFCTTQAPSAPAISATPPVRTNTTSITGTSTENGGTIRLYRNGVEVIATAPVVVNGGNWSFALPAGTSLALGDKLTTTVTRAATESCPEMTSASSGPVTVGTSLGACATTPPIISRITNKDALIGTTIYPGATVTIFKDGIFFATTTASTIPTTTGGTIYEWTYDNAQYSRDFAYPRNGNGSSSRDYATVNATVTPTNNGCQSGRSNSFYINSETSTPVTDNTPQTTQAPVVTTTSVCNSTTTISGTAEPGALIFLYINNVPVNQLADGSIGTINANINTPTITFNTPNAVAAGSPLNSTTSTVNSAAWSVDITPYGLVVGDKVSFKAVVANNTTGTGNNLNYPSGYEGLSAPSTELVVTNSCPTTAPVITTSTLSCPTPTVITGTITGEVDGTLVTVYRRDGTTPNPATDTRLTNAAAVSGGNWSATILSGFTPNPGDILYAVAAAPGKTASVASNTITVATPGTAASYGLVVNPIKERATTITGTATTTGTVYVYIDGIKMAGTASVTASGSTPTTWSIAVTPENQLNLSTGVRVTASILPTTTGTCESQQTAPVTVLCNEPSKNPTFSPASQTICRGNVAVITLSGSEDGVVYQLYNGETASGPSVAGDAKLTTITLRSAPLTSTTSLKVRAYRAESPSCQVTLNGTATITVNPGPTAFAVSPASLSICNGSTATVKLAGSESNTSYQIQVYNPATDTYSNTGNAVEGNGSAIQLSTATLTVGGTFKVVATGGGCTVDMGNAFTVFVPANNLAITPASRSICSGATASITVKGSQNGVSYRIFTGTTPSGVAVTGNGGDITLTTDALTAVGTTTFKVVATASALPSCPVDLTQTFTVTVTPTLTTPSITLTSSTPLCDGGTATVSVTNSLLGVAYQIFNGNYASGPVVIGTGHAITLTSASLTNSTSLTVRASNSCGAFLTSATVTVPVNTIAAYTLSSTTTNICSSGTATVTLAGSEANTTYSLQYFDVVSRTYKEFSPARSFTTGTTAGATVSLTTPALTASTTLKMVASRGGCFKDMANTVEVTVSATTLNFTPASQTVCSNSAASVTVLSSQRGVSYQLQIITGTSTYTNNGAAVVGTGGDIVLTSTTTLATGTHNFRILATPTGCTSYPSATFSVKVGLPTAQTVTLSSSASVCAGSTATVSLISSEVGVTYQLFIGTTATGYPVQGTGESIKLTTEPLTATSTLKVVANRAGCTPVDMSGTPSVTVSTPPVAYAVSPTSQTICYNGTAQVTLANSQSGVTYQLYNGSTPTGASRVSTGGALTLTSGVLTVNATLTVQAVVSGGCGNVTMTGFSEVTVSPTPVAASISSSATNFCGSGTATITANSNLVKGVTYQLYRNGVAEGNSVTYTGSNPISFTAAVSATAKFTIVASSASCPSVSSNEVTVTVSPVPASAVISASPSTICGSGSVTITATSNLVNGVTYQLFRNGIAEGSTQTYNGSNTIAFTASVSTSAATKFTVVASNGSCTPATSNEVTVVNALPTTPVIAAWNNTTTFCGSGSTSITVQSPVNGESYLLYKENGTTPVATIPYTGAGSVEFYVNVTATTSYTVKAANATCTSAASNTIHFTVSACPSITYTVEPAYEVRSYVIYEIIAKPVYPAGKYTSFSVEEGSLFLSGTAYSTRTGEIYVSKAYSENDPTSLTHGTRTVNMLAFEPGATTPVKIPVTYSISPIGNPSAAPRLGSPVTLPVTLISFKAEASPNQGIQLNWSTASEKDNDYFLVERSLNGKAFASIGQVKGNGTTNVVQHYHFTDGFAPAGTVYYRLKQVDFDGKSEYSKAISVKATGSKAAAQVGVSPNPFQHQLSFSINSAETRQVQVALYDLHQKLIYKEALEVAAGKVSLTKELSTLANGVYLLKVTGAGLSEAIRVVKQD